jgi:hypothetical protein
MLMFVSTDLKQMVSFPATSFKILPNPNNTDFSPDDLDSARGARRERSKLSYPFPFKSRSELVWGDRDACTLATLLTAEMFRPLRK